MVRNFFKVRLAGGVSQGLFQEFREREKFHFLLKNNQLRFYFFSFGVLGRPNNRSDSLFKERLIPARRERMAVAELLAVR